MVFKDYYKILDLETSRVSIDEVKIAYRAAAKKYHPDVNVGDKLAEERIKDINEAYRTLSVPASKRKYDRIWNSNVGNKQRTFNDKGNSASIFDIFLGNVEKEKNIETKKNNPIKGENIETAITINIYEAFNGTEKKIALREVDGSLRNYTVSVPAGIREGEKVRLIGQGKEGKNGGKNGDLLIKINIENDKDFTLKGYDLYTNLYLTPWEAALGSRVDVKSLEDETKVYIPQGIQSGEIIKIPGKGYKDGKGNKGDLIAEIKIMVPKKLSKEEKEIFEKLNKISKFNPRNI